jgi:hypothetical protein
LGENVTAFTSQSSYTEAGKEVSMKSYATRYPLTPRAAGPSRKLDKAAATQELKKVIGGSHEVLVSASTVFPFTLFPDTVTVDREKVTVVNRFFFRVAETVSIAIEDILNVTADVGPFFGSLKILTRFYDPEKPYSVDYLWRGDAERLKRILQGYVIAHQKAIDCTPLETKELARMLNKLGMGAPDGS